MEPKEAYAESHSRNLIDELDRLRRFNGSPPEFWPVFLESSAALAGAVFGLLLGPDDDGGVSWKPLSVWPRQGRTEIRNPDSRASIDEVAKGAWSAGFSAVQNGRASFVGVRLGVEGDRGAVAVYGLPDSSRLTAEEIRIRLTLVAESPSVYQLGRLLNQARADVGKFSDGMDLMALLNDQKRYIAAAMTFCNEIASRFRCDRAGLGWLKDQYIRVQAISHIERFEKKMDLVQDLEGAMEEALDQDEEVALPRPAENGPITRAHEVFVKRAGTAFVVSIPIRLDGAPVGVLTCERSTEPFSEATIRSLRLLCDLAARRLGDLKEHDRWIGARLVTAARDNISRLVGVQHTFAKILGVLLAGLLAFAIFGRLNYRVEAPFILKSDDVVFVSAPFDGYIEQVNVNVGDVVEAGKLLIRFDTRELLLEEASAIANQIRYQREAERARAQRATADQKIAEALADQASARLRLVRHYLKLAEVRAPYSGVVVEGDLRELRGTPTRKGDALFKIARTANLYAELEIDERDSHEIADGLDGELAFLSRPGVSFPISVVQTDPVAVTREEKNVFLARASLNADSASWWKPGMSGVAKVNIGPRNVLWILMHRTVDFLRMYFWW